MGVAAFGCNFRSGPMVAQFRNLRGVRWLGGFWVWDAFWRRIERWCKRKKFKSIKRFPVENQVRDLKSATTLITNRNGPMMCDVIQPQVCIGTIVAFKCFFVTFWPYFRRWTQLIYWLMAHHQITYHWASSHLQLHHLRILNLFCMLAAWMQLEVLDDFLSLMRLEELFCFRLCAVILCNFHP